MIEPEDLIFLDTAPHQSNLLIGKAGALNRATVDSIASKLTGLESTPVIGAFDASHLQKIHVRVFQDALPRAGQLREPRPSSLSSSLDSLFDKLARENRLKGLELDEWSKRAAEYLQRIERINPFDEGSDIVSIELFRELAAESGLPPPLVAHVDGVVNGRTPHADPKPAERQPATTANTRSGPRPFQTEVAPSRDRNNSLDLIPFI